MVTMVLKSPQSYILDSGQYQADLLWNAYRTYFKLSWQSWLFTIKTQLFPPPPAIKCFLFNEIIFP